MKNLLSYCGLVDAKIRASDKDLPVVSNADWNRCNLLWQKVSGDKSPLSPYVPPGLRTGGEPASARRGVGRSKMLSLAASKC
jgi:hypothetical protein